MVKEMTAYEYVRRWIEAMDYVDTYYQAPSYAEMPDEFNEMGFTREDFEKAIDQIGAELEEEGYQLMWDIPKTDGDSRWFVLGTSYLD